MKKIIGVCGAHGTGKTTLISEIVKQTQLPVFQSSSTALWKKYNITDFEILPKTVRSVFQNIGLLEHIRREDEYKEDVFISDRTILDYLMYTFSSSDLGGVDLDVHIALIKERMKIYSGFIFIKPHPEITRISSNEEKFARAKISLQEENTKTIETYLNLWNIPHLLIEDFDLDTRSKKAVEYINSILTM